MKPNFSSLLLGLGLIAVGGFAFANQANHFENLTPQTWISIFAISGALFFAAYFLNGIRAWGWLFPACISLALSGSIALSEYSTADAWIPTLMMGSVSIPFFVAYLLGPSRTWALIPASIIAFISVIPLLDKVLKGEMMGAFIVAAIGLFFAVAYLMSPKNWWAIIPGGILFGISLLIAFESSLPNGGSVVLLFFVWMLTFGIIWKREEHSWARIPVIVTGVLASIMLLVTLGLEDYWALGLIVAGVALIATNLFRRTQTLAN
jgi:hypothetical protein